MQPKRKEKRTYIAPRSAYIANINVSDEIPTRANINAMNQAYSDARQQANNIRDQYELNKRKSILQDSIDRNIVNEKILSIGESQRPIDTRQFNNLFLNRTRFKIGGNIGRKRYAVGGSFSNGINRRNYWFDENDGVTSESNYTPEPTTQPTYNIASANTNVTNTNNNTTNRTRRTTSQKNKSNTSSNNIVTIGTRSFGDAFKQARNAGLDKFRWKGRVYGTRYASEVNNTSNVQGDKNTSIRSNTSTKNNPSNTGTNTTTPRRASSSIDIPFMSRTKQAVSNARSSTSNTNNNQTNSTKVQRQIIQRLNLDNNVNDNQLYYSTAALNNKINSMPTLRDNTTPTFYEARRRAQQLGQKSFTWRGNTYSTYGRTK